MKKNLKKALAIILAIMTICAVFAGCKNNKEDENTNPTVNGTTQAEGWSENTTKKKDDEASTNESTSSSTAESTTKKETTTAKKETTTKTYYNNNNSNSAKPTTTKKHTTTTQKPVTTTKPATKPPVTTTTTKPAAKKPLTDAQKQWVIENYFGKFPQNGAKPGFYYEDIGTDDGLITLMEGLTQNNYKQLVQERIDAGGLRYEAKGCTRVWYNWSEQNGESMLRYKCITN